MKMNNRWFFVLDKLQIRPSERFFVGSLITLIALAWVIEPFIEPKSLFDDAYYAPIVGEFKKHAADNYREREETLKRYYPGDESAIGKYAVQALPAGLDESIKKEIIERGTSFGISHPGAGIPGDDVPGLTDETNPEIDTDTIPKSPAAKTGPKINLNKSGVADLMKLPGIGLAIAQRIVDYRDQNGAFKRVDDLMRVNGIGAAKFEKLKDLIEV